MGWTLQPKASTFSPRRSLPNPNCRRQFHKEYNFNFNINVADATMHCTTRMLLTGAFATPLSRATTLPPAFLLPAFATHATSSSFSTSTTHCARKDGNPERNLSALHRSGMNKHMLRESKTGKKDWKRMLDNLPKPVLDRSKHTPVEVDENHGLWGFFNEARTSMATPTELHAHGRAWTIQELRKKDWNDLHRLWWVCIKEMNRLRTSDAERERVGNMYGQHESENRLVEVKKTMKRIKFALTERWYAWENARTAAMEDEEINMYADLDNGEPAYLVVSFLLSAVDVV